MKNILVRVKKEKEKILNEVKFNVFSFSNKQRPSSNILFVCCFSEFGCETISCMYGFQRIRAKYPKHFVVAVGWYGREYLYRHLVDEFWEIERDAQFLRDSVNAHKSSSVNIKNIEKNLKKIGTVINTEYFGKIVNSNFCHCCGNSVVYTGTKICNTCFNGALFPSCIVEPDQAIKNMTPIPKPRKEKIEWAKKILNNKKYVAIFARGRKTYGRNLPSYFYVWLIDLLKGKGYGVIWLGEKQSTQKCPDDSVIDFSRMEESNDLENTLAILSLCDFTIQYWTASTRLAAIVDTPFILFESFNQIRGQGQEGARIKLLGKKKKKIVYCSFQSFLDDLEKGMKITDEAIDEFISGDLSEKYGIISDEETTINYRNKNFDYSIVGVGNKGYYDSNFFDS